MELRSGRASCKKVAHAGLKEWTTYVVPATLLLTSYPGPDLPIGYIGLSLGPQDPRGAPTIVVRIESMAGI